MEDSNKSIYPFMFHQGTEDEWSNTGLTKREYFAGLAMQGFIASGDLMDWEHEDVAKISLKMADALINALSK